MSEVLLENARMKYGSVKCGKWVIDEWKESVIRHYKTLQTHHDNS